jgi:hypothetical protein
MTMLFVVSSMARVNSWLWTSDLEYELRQNEKPKNSLEGGC